MSTFRSTIELAAEEALRRVTDHFEINHDDAWAIFAGAPPPVGREDRAAKTAKKVKKTTTSPGEGPHSREDLEAMTIPTLSTILKTNKLRMAGNKGDKIDRILDFQENPAPPPKKKGGRKKKNKEPEPSHNHSLHAESGSHKSCEHCELYGNPLKMSPGGEIGVVNGPTESAGSTQSALKPEDSAARSALKPEDSAAQSALKPEDSAAQSALKPEDSAPQSTLEDEDEIAEACKMTVKSWASVASVDDSAAPSVAKSMDSTCAREDRLAEIFRNEDQESEDDYEWDCQE